MSAGASLSRESSGMEVKMKDFKFSALKYERPDLEALGETLRQYTKRVQNAGSYARLPTKYYENSVVLKRPLG